MSGYDGGVRWGVSLAALLASCGANERVFVVPPPPVEGIRSQVVLVETEIDRMVRAFSSVDDQRLVTDIPAGQITRIETLAYTQSLAQLELKRGPLTPAPSGAEADNLPPTEHRFVLKADGLEDQLSWESLAEVDSQLARFRIPERRGGCVSFEVDTHALDSHDLGVAVRVGERAVLVSTRTPRHLLVRPGEAPVELATTATVTFIRSHRDGAGRVWASDTSGHVYRLTVDDLTLTATRMFRTGDGSNIEALAVDAADDPSVYTVHASGAVLQHRDGVAMMRYQFGPTGGPATMAMDPSGVVYVGHAQIAELVVIGPDAAKQFRTPSLSVASVVVHPELGTIIGTFTGELYSFDGAAFERLNSERFAAGAWTMAVFGSRVVYSGPIVKAVGQYSPVEYCELEFVLSSGGHTLVPLGNEVVVVMGQDTQRRGFVSVLTAR